jgi:hypothetical protein
MEFAQEKTVPTSLFLSLFQGKFLEIQVSQSFNDGNKDVQWNRGVIFTAKQEGLWEPTKRVPPEDVRHIRNRVLEFPLTVPMDDNALVDVVSCATCMCDWIVQACASGDAASVLRTTQPVPSTASVDSSRLQGIHGLDELFSIARLPEQVCAAFVEDLEQLGAVAVAELSLTDWEALNAWALLRPLQVRRILQHLSLA